MSGMDVLRERIAQALWEESGGTREWAKWPDDMKKGSGAYDMADAEIAALGLVEWTSVGLGGQEFQHYAITWERIEEDGQ